MWRIKSTIIFLLNNLGFLKILKIKIKLCSSNNFLRSLNVYDSSPRHWVVSFLPISNKAFLVELSVGNEKKHTCFAYIAKSKTGPNRENRPYNQIKMCMCVEYFWMELAPLSAWLYLLFWNMGYLSFFFFFPCFRARTHFLFSFLLHSPYFYHNEYEESCQRDGAFLCGCACFCVTSSVEVSIWVTG